MPVEVVACMLADKNSWKRLQFQLILQCAPLFKGYKVACITNVRREDMRNMHLLLNGTGICYRALTFCRDKYLVLLYRPAQLKTYLKQPEVKTFLADYGYEENSLEKVLERLSLRAREMRLNFLMKSEFSLTIHWKMSEALLSIKDRTVSFVDIGKYIMIRKKQNLHSGHTIRQRTVQ